MSPEVVYYVASSLDGYIATLDGGVAWLDPYQQSGDDHDFGDFYASVDGLLMGSHTYEFSLAHPPWRSSDKRSWVFTGRELPVADPSVTLTPADPGSLLQSLGSEFRRLWLMGGGQLAASFRQRGLISGYEIFVIPVLLGEGIPLFAPGPGQETLELVDSKKHASGIVRLSLASTGI